MKILSVRGIANVVPGSEKERRELLSRLSLTNIYDNTILHLYKHSYRSIEIPINSIRPQPMIEDNPEWGYNSFSFKGELRPEQNKIVIDYLTHIESGYPCGGIIQSPTGTGKTIMAINIMGTLGLKTLIIVPTDHLMIQWQRELKKFSNLSDKDIGICRGHICNYKNREVVIGMIHSLAKANRYSEEFYKCFGFCIVDEVHRLSAPTFSQSIPQFWTKHRLGLSATARRKDGLENVFLYHIGDICNRQIQQPVKPKVIVMRYYNPQTHHTGCIWGGKLSLGKYFNKISAVESRNRFIADVIAKLYHKGRDILVLSDRIRQLSTLRTMLVDEKVEESEIGIFTGQIKSGLDRKIILGTYGSAGLGADIPRLSAIVFATPHADIEQAVGRVLRKEMDTPQIIVDIVDTASNIMVGWHYARMKYYKRITDNFHYMEVRN